MNQERTCSCRGWKLSFPSLDSATRYAETNGRSYRGRELMFCPWCGAALTNEIEGLKKKVRYLGGIGATANGQFQLDNRWFSITTTPYSNAPEGAGFPPERQN